jgi:uncharacterized protein
MHIDLSEILSRENLVKELEVPFEAEKIRYYGDDANIVSKQPVKLTLQNEGKNKAYIKGETSFGLMLKCGRCLKPVEYQMSLTPEVRIPCESEEGSEELSYVSGHSFDVDGFVLDECYVQLPMNVLCSEDCKGLCIKCGKNLNEGSCNCDTFVPDPRMTRILDIYNANKEEV